MQTRRLFCNTIDPFASFSPQRECIDKKAERQEHRARAYMTAVTDGQRGIADEVIFTSALLRDVAEHGSLHTNGDDNV